MKKTILILATMLFSASAFAKIVYVRADSQSELDGKVQQTVKRINSGRHMAARNCRRSKVYAVQFKDTSGSYVADKYGNLRPVRPTAIIKFSCKN